MNVRLSLAILMAAAVWAQAPNPAPPAAPPAVTAPSPATPNPSGAPSLSSVLAMPDNAVVATANGKKMTAGELKPIVQKIPPQQLQQVDPKDLLVQIALLRQFAADAATQKLDQRSPIKEELENVRNQVLANAYLNEVRTNGITITPDEVQKHYETNKNRYEQAKIRLIYFGFENQPGAPAANGASKPKTETEAKAKAEAVLKDLRAGGDFVKAVKENSDDPVSKAKDGQFAQPLHRTDQIPDNIKSAVFSLKPGGITDVIQQPNGFYIFRADEIGVQTLDQVRDQVTKELKESKFQDWIQKARSGVQIAFEAAPAAVAPAAPGASK